MFDESVNKLQAAATQVSEALALSETEFLKHPRAQGEIATLDSCKELAGKVYRVIGNISAELGQLAKRLNTMLTSEGPKQAG